MADPINPPPADHQPPLVAPSDGRDGRKYVLSSGADVVLEFDGTGVQICDGPAITDPDELARLPAAGPAASS